MPVNKIKGKTITVQEYRNLLKGRVVKKKLKYGNKLSISNGEKYDSNKEKNRHGLLILQEKNNIIKDLKRQVKFDFLVNEKHICSYVADFTYTITKSGKYVVEDVKSIATRKNRVYAIKKKLMDAIFNINIYET